MVRTHQDSRLGMERFVRLGVGPGMRSRAGRDGLDGYEKDGTGKSVRGRRAQNWHGLSGGDRTVRARFVNRNGTGLEMVRVVGGGYGSVCR